MSPPSEEDKYSNIEPFNDLDESDGSDEAPARSRIARAGQRLKAEAARTLGKETPPRKLRPARPLRESRLPSLTDGLGEAERADLLELLDDGGSTLVLMPRLHALKQNLRLRLAAVVLRTRQNKIVLHRRSEEDLEDPGVWDLYTDFVLVGEAPRDAAIRLLNDAAQIGGLRLADIAEIEHGNMRFTLHVADLPAGVYPAGNEGELLELDADELRGLMRDSPELFSAVLNRAVEHASLFRNTPPPA